MSHLPDDSLTQRILQCVAELLRNRTPGFSICASDAAQQFAQRQGCDWRDVMRLVRTVISALVDAGILDALQEERRVDFSQTRGPIRLRVRNEKMAMRMLFG
ncbi:MAG: DUF3253 domain-containing protein [Dokdonella sp.]